MDLLSSLDATFDHARGVIAGVRREGRFGPEVASPDAASPTERLVRFLGRMP